jgi:hypothetical protein
MVVLNVVLPGIAHDPLPRDTGSPVASGASSGQVRSQAFVLLWHLVPRAAVAPGRGAAPNTLPCSASVATTGRPIDGVFRLAGILNPELGGRVWTARVAIPQRQIYVFELSLQLINVDLRRRWCAWSGGPFDAALHPAGFRSSRRAIQARRPNRG